MRLSFTPVCRAISRFFSSKQNESSMIRSSRAERDLRASRAWTRETISNGHSVAELIREAWFSTDSRLMAPSSRDLQRGPGRAQSGTVDLLFEGNRALPREYDVSPGGELQAAMGIETICR